MRERSLFIFLLILPFFLLGCSDEGDDLAVSRAATLVTITTPISRSVEVIEESIGTLQSNHDPILFAETSGKIQRVYVNAGETVQKGQLLASLELKDLSLNEKAQLAEVKRLEVLLAQHKRNTKRYQELKKKQAVSEAMLDEAQAQEGALSQQITAAKARLALTQREVEKAKIIAPFDAQIEKIMAIEGSFVRQGEPLFRIVDSHLLQAYLPFPENVASLLKPGLKVRLTTPTHPDHIVESIIAEIKPMTGTHNRALEIIVQIPQNQEWKAGSSVKGQVVVSGRAKAWFVPEICVVMRPQGKVVYVVNAKQYVEQRIVETGAHQDGFIEIKSGLAGNEKIVQDGAGFLTDQALVKTQAQKARA